MTGEGKGRTLAAELRRAFDASFAAPPAAPAAETENLVALQVAGDPYAIRLSEITGLYLGRKIALVPSRAPELLGVAGVRGGIVPVYSLRALLGYPPGGDPPRWLVVVGSDGPLGFAFETFEGHLRVDRADLSATTGESPRPYVREALRAGGTLRAVISLPSMTEALGQRI